MILIIIVIIVIIVINIVIIDPDQVISSVAIGGELLPRFKENLEKVPINDHKSIFQIGTN